MLGNARFGGIGGLKFVWEFIKEFGAWFEEKVEGGKATGGSRAVWEEFVDEAEALAFLLAQEGARWCGLLQEKHLKALVIGADAPRKFSL